MQLITDRTESDALLKNEKGTYSYADLNRVESAVEEISNYFPALGIDELNLQTKTDWGFPSSFAVTEWPTVLQMERYLRNVSAVRDAFSLSIPLPQSMNRLTWTGANNIEKVLQQAIRDAGNSIQVFRYSGEVFSGEE